MKIPTAEPRNCLKGRRAEQNPTAERQSQENPSTKEDNLWAGNAAGSHQKSFEEVQHQFVPLIPGPTGQSSRISRFTSLLLLGTQEKLSFQPLSNRNGSQCSIKTHSRARGPSWCQQKPQIAPSHPFTSITPPCRQLLLEGKGRQQLPSELCRPRTQRTRSTRGFSCTLSSLHEKQTCAGKSNSAAMLGSSTDS